MDDGRPDQSWRWRSIPWPAPNARRPRGSSPRSCSRSPGDVLLMLPRGPVRRGAGGRVPGRARLLHRRLLDGRPGRRRLPPGGPLISRRDDRRPRPSHSAGRPGPGSGARTPRSPRYMVVDRRDGLPSAGQRSGTRVAVAGGRSSSRAPEHDDRLGPVRRRVPPVRALWIMSTYHLGQALPGAVAAPVNRAGGSPKRPPEALPVTGFPRVLEQAGSRADGLPGDRPRTRMAQGRLPPGGRCPPAAAVSRRWCCSGTPELGSGRGDRAVRRGAHRLAPAGPRTPRGAPARSEIKTRARRGDPPRRQPGPGADPWV